jgi:hypothetical protein
VIDGGGATLTTGAFVDLFIDFACTVQGVTALADQTGSVTVDIYVCTYAQFDAGATHPVAADKITASAPVAISSANKYQDTTLTGWTTSIPAGRVVRFIITGTPTTITRVETSLKVVRS